MDAPLISHERAGDQRKQHNQDNALFTFRKHEDSEQAFHFFT
jgi:hypothetical protein